MKRILLFTLAASVLFSCSEEEKAPVNPDTVIKGKITNADGNTAWIETFKNERTQATLNANGEFEIKIALTQPGCFDLVNGKARTYLCLAPGDTVNVTFDAKDIDKTVKYEGKDAAFLNYLANKQRAVIELMTGEYDSLYMLSADTFLLTAETLSSKLKASYDAIKNDTNIDKTILSWEEKALGYDKMALILSYPRNYKMMKMIDSVPGLDKIVNATKDLALNDGANLQLISYRNALNSYIELNSEKELAADTAAVKDTKKALWNAIEKNVTDAAVKDYLEFNHVRLNYGLDAASEAKDKLKASTKDTVYLKQLK